MANPQGDKDYTKVSNEIIEALALTDLSNYEFRVFMMLIRKTYGFHKKTDWISLSQLAERTGIKLSHICRTIKKLKAKNMIIKNGKITGIQKDYEQWKLPKQVTNLNGKVTQTGKLPKQVILPKQVSKVTQTGNKKLPKQGDTKEKKYTYTKETILLSELLYEKILENNPEHKKPNFNNWYLHMDKMIRIDKRDPNKIKEVITWCQKDDFWHKNILSTAKLREKYDQLILNMGKNKKQKTFSGDYRV